MSFESTAMMMYKFLMAWRGEPVASRSQPLTEGKQLSNVKRALGNKTPLVPPPPPRASAMPDLDADADTKELVAAVNEFIDAMGRRPTTIMLAVMSPNEKIRLAGAADRLGYALVPFGELKGEM